jgi:hypothetical protein
MRNLLRQPLTWMVIAECIVVTLLIVIVWNVVEAAAATSQHGAIPAQQSVTSPVESPTPALPDVVQARSASPVQLPGLNLNSGFWRVRLGQVNSEQVVFEQLEWRLVHSAMDAAQGYLETVVLPSITRAERA